MLREGPIPRFVHGIFEYLEGIAFIVVPLVAGFQSGSAVATSIVVGVIVIVLAASTRGPTSLVNQVPISAHVVFDYLLAGFLIAAPFLFGFSWETPPLAFFLAVGVLHLLVTIATRFLPEGAGPEPGRREPGAASPRSGGETPPPRA
jgi:hypothetical protein